MFEFKQLSLLIEKYEGQHKKAETEFEKNP